jgi:hypothetical protein
VVSRPAADVGDDAQTRGSAVRRGPKPARHALSGPLRPAGTHSGTGALRDCCTSSFIRVWRNAGSFSASSTEHGDRREQAQTQHQHQNSASKSQHPPPNTHHPPRTTQQDGSAPAPLFACVRYRTPPPTGKRPERRRRLFRFAVRFVVSDGSSGPIRPSLNLSNHVRR